MAEEETGQERREEPTQRRMERAREEGQVPRSRELNTAAVLLAGSSALLMFGQSLGERVLVIGRESFEWERAAAFDTQYMATLMRWSLSEALLVLSPIFILLLLAALLAPSALGGWLFSTKAMMPNFQRLDPMAGLARMFSVRALVELVKAVAKVLVVGSFAWLVLHGVKDALLAIASQSVESAVTHAMGVLGWSALALSASTLLIAAIDVPFQLHEHAKKLRMTIQQVRDEMKDSEGKPEVKSRIRQLQRQLARNRMMSAVPKADVIITNPTHYAVALRYDVEQANAPLLLAKGSDQVALKIREIAQAHGVPIVRSPKLARAIFYTTELEREIPAGLYIAVAQVLAYVFHLRNYRRGQGKAPLLPEEFSLPEEMEQVAARGGPD